VNVDAFDADYFDGVSSARRAVRVRRDGDHVRIVGDGLEIVLRHDELRVQPRVARTPLRILLPGNALLLASADDVAPVLGIPAARGLAHRLESHLGVVLLSILGVAVCAWLGVQHGIPWAARVAASHIPPDVERGIATETLEQLDHLVLKPTRLAAARQDEVRALFRGLRERAGGVAEGARLEFRDGNWIGANAFALPGGVVIATDQLVNLMGNDDRIAAVLAHELGHLQNRHGSRQILQGSMVGLLTVALAGDASTLATAVVGLPTLLLHTGYSRDFEREADRYAYALLRETGRSPRLLGEALTQLESARARAHDDEECRPEGASQEPKAETPKLGYLSTHPDTAERIRDAEEAAR
jgi:Zn-dependent protease with chaperone function